MVTGYAVDNWSSVHIRGRIVVTVTRRNTQLVWLAMQLLSGCVPRCMATVTRKQVLNSMQRQDQARAETYIHSPVHLHVLVLNRAQASKT